MFPKSDALPTYRSMSGSPIESLRIEQSFALLIDFYEIHRAEGAVPVSEDGDMLLFQWGPNKWADGAPFEINLTRQIIYPDEEDYETLQLGLTYSFMPDASLGELDKGNVWFADPLDTGHVRENILASPVVIHCTTIDPTLVNLKFEQV